MSERNELVYVALGGAGEIGMNMYLYGYGPEDERRWIIVDCGVTFGDMASSPGVELVLPDISFIADERRGLEAIFITHAHEDHIGALARHWRRLGAPIYMTRFTAEIGKRKLEEEGVSGKEIRIVAPHEAVRAGPFDCRFMPVTHSVPEAMSLAIRTPLGLVVHSGDFKFDDAPIIAPPTDTEALRALGDDGVLALTCDSTNVFETGRAGSEESVRAPLARVFRECEGAVAATSFASNVTRLRTLAEVARDAGRSTVVAGRAMQRMIDAALATGAIPDFPDTIAPERADDLPAENVFYLVTGSQGEARAALGRIANGSHPTVTLGEGDTVLFSSRMIPGNEREVLKVYNRLAERGVRVIDADADAIHVSGHACRQELEELYALLRPRISVPLHGEFRHLVEHARLAEEWGSEHSIVAPNGSMVRLAVEGENDARPAVVDAVATGRVYLDGKLQVGALDGVIRSRLRMARQGHVSVAVTVDEDGEISADPVVKLMGVPAEDEQWPSGLTEMIAEAVDDAMDGMGAKARRDVGRIEEVVSQVARKTCDRRWGKKPEVSVLVVTLEYED